MNDNVGAKLEAYKSQQSELVKKYDGKIIAMIDGVLQGVYEGKLEALEDMKKRFPGASYFIIKCTDGDEEYTRRFRSRVYFPEMALA